MSCFYPLTVRRYNWILSCINCNGTLRSLEIDRVHHQLYSGLRTLVFIVECKLIFSIINFHLDNLNLGCHRLLPRMAPDMLRLFKFYAGCMTH